MKQQKYKLLFLGFVPYIGGAEISTLLLLRHLDREKFSPVYIIPDVGPLFDQVKGLGVKVVVMSLDQIKLPFPLGYLRTVWNLTQFIRKNNIDLVICTVEICNQYSLPAARLNRIPIACHTRNLIPCFRSFWRSWLSGDNRFQCPESWDLPHWASRLPLYSPLPCPLSWWCWGYTCSCWPGGSAACRGVS